MPAATQLTDFSDLYTDLMNRVRVDTSETATSTQAKRFINIGLHDMHLGNGEKFPWCEREATLITNQSYTTGTVTISQGSVALTGSGTAWNTNNAFGVANVRAGGKFVFAGSTDSYEVDGVASDTSVTLKTKLVQSDLSGATYRYYEDEYDLAADFLRPLDMQYFDRNSSIDFIDRKLFRRKHPRNNTVGKIVEATIVDRPKVGNTDPRRRVVFWKPPEDFQQVTYDYVTSYLGVTSAGAEQTQLISDDDEPIVPLYARHLIVLHALYNWYRDKKNDDDREKSAKGEYDSAMVRLLGAVETGAVRPQMRPTPGLYSRPSRRPYNRKGRRYTLGTSFDEIRD